MCSCELIKGTETHQNAEDVENVIPNQAQVKIFNKLVKRKSQWIADWKNDSYTHLQDKK